MVEEAVRGPGGMSRPADEGGDDEIDLSQLLRTLWLGKWVILLCAVIGVFLGLLYLLVTPPTYRADALIQIQSEDTSPLQGVTSELSQLTGKNASPAQGEIQIIKSRSVLGDAVDALNLTVSTRPDYFPFFGYGIARLRDGGEPPERPVEPASAGWLGNYAWATPKSVNVSRMTVPPGLNGQPFVLRSLGAGAYTLLGPEGETILRGVAGEPATGAVGDLGEVSLFVTEIGDAAPPTDFILIKRQWLPVVENLARQLSVSEQGDETGVVQIALEGTDRTQITQILNSIAENYLRQNVEAKSEQAQRSLEFLNEQLPELRNDVETAENRLAQFQEENQVADLNNESRALLDQVVNLENKQSSLQLRVSQLRQEYTAQHPRVQAAVEQLREIQSQREALESNIAQLPEAQKRILSLQRDVQVNTQLYTSLLNRAQELRVMKAGTVGNVRIIDQARLPVEPIAPQKSLVLALAIILGIILGGILVFLRLALNRGVSDPRLIEKSLGIKIYAVIPFSSWLLKERGRRKRGGQSAPVLVRDHGEDPAAEALLGLRTGLYFERLAAEQNVIVVSGPTPGVGKSFTSMNLAFLLADIDKRVVLIDADMRRGRLHEFLPGNAARSPGLSEVLQGSEDWRNTLHKIDETELFILPSGALPGKPSSLLMRDAYAATIRQLKSEFDVVVIDAPPILAVTDAAITSAITPDAFTLLVARSGRHSMSELEESINRFSSSTGKQLGIVVNGYRQRDAEYVGNYAYYQYGYQKNK